MKKKRVIILLSILAVLLVIGCFTFLYRAASAEKDSFYDYYITNNEDAERLSRIPQKVELGSDSKPGYTLRFQDYSLTLSGYDDAVIENNNSDNGSIYYIDGERTIVFFKWRSILAGSNIFEDPALLSQIENATGRDVNTFYDNWEASFYCTPDDYSMFDIDKNKIVSMLLEFKWQNIGDICYQFDNGVIKGFICASASQEDPENYNNAIVLFSNCDDSDSFDVPDSFYMITFDLFSVDEVKDILSTITQGGNNTK